MKQPNEAARDLRSQIFERATTEPDATLHEPDEDAEAVQNEAAVWSSPGLWTVMGIEIPALQRRSFRN